MKIDWQKLVESYATVVPTVKQSISPTYPWRKFNCADELNTPTFNFSKFENLHAARYWSYKWISLQISLYSAQNAMLSLFSGFFRRFIYGSIRRSAGATRPSRRIFRD